LARLADCDYHAGTPREAASGRLGHLNEESTGNVFEGVLQLLHDFWSGLVVGQIEQLGNWNYVVLAVLTILEGPIVTLLAAVAASGGLLNPELVFVSAAAGNLTSDVLWYSLGYLGKTEWLVRHFGRFGVRPDHLERLERAMNRHAREILIVAKLTLSFAIPALIAAGVMRVPWRKWLPTIMLGELIWSGSLVLIGYHFTLTLRRMEIGLQVVALVGLVVVLALAARYLTRYGARFERSQDQ